MREYYYSDDNISKKMRKIKSNCWFFFLALDMMSIWIFLGAGISTILTAIFIITIIPIIILGIIIISYLFLIDIILKIKYKVETDYLELREKLIFLIPLSFVIISGKDIIINIIRKILIIIKKIIMGIFNYFKSLIIDIFDEIEKSKIKKIEELENKEKSLSTLIADIEVHLTEIRKISEKKEEL